MELVINTYGVSIKRENEGFIVSTADDTQRIPAVGIDRILISRGAQITSDVSRACFFSVDAKAYYNPAAVAVVMDDYVRADNVSEFFQINSQLINDIITRSHNTIFI